MHRSTSRAIAIALSLAVGALGVAACGSSNDKSSGGSSSSSSSSASSGAKKLKVGLVTDIGGLNDRSFNFLANKGLQDAQQQLGIEGRTLISKSKADYIPNLSTLAEQKYDLVIGVGFLMADAVATVAKKFPNVKFAIIQTGYEGGQSHLDGAQWAAAFAGARRISGDHATINEALRAIGVPRRYPKDEFDTIGLAAYSHNPRHLEKYRSWCSENDAQGVVQAAVVESLSERVHAMWPHLRT